MKGSSVDRLVLSPAELNMIKDGQIANIIDQKKKVVLKDNDFKALKMSFKLSKKDAQNLITYISSDAEFLKGSNITDYSLLVTIHKFNESEVNLIYKNYRLMKSFDDNYIYNFSLIDYLTVINNNLAL